MVKPRNQDDITENSTAKKSQLRNEKREREEKKQREGRNLI